MHDTERTVSQPNASDRSSVFAPKPASVFVAAGVTASLAGVLAAWVVAPIDVSLARVPVTVWASVAVWPLVAGLLATQRVPSAVVAYGCYVAAAFALIGPVRAFGPTLDTGGTGGLEDVLFWGLVAVVAAAAFALVGRRLRQHARRRVAYRERKRGYAGLS